jgi:hypothetical protein
MLLLQKNKNNARVSMHLIFHNFITFSKNLQAIVSHEERCEGIHKLIATKFGPELTLSTKVQFFSHVPTFCKIFIF